MHVQRGIQAAGLPCRPPQPRCHTPRTSNVACSCPARPAEWWRDSILSRVAGLCLAGLVGSTAASLPLLVVPPASAAIPLGPGSEEAQRAWALRQMGVRYPVRAAPDQTSSNEPEPVSQRIKQLQQLMTAGNAAAADGDYAAALACYNSIVRQFPDFATTEYARLARALMLYQTGAVSDAILQLEDLEVSLRGYAEVHAALAAILYAERPALVQQAEQQWEVAMEFNKNFSDPQWVAATKHWPPRLMAALDRFLNLQ